MKKILQIFLLIAAASGHAQLTEVYNFGFSNGPSSNDFRGNTQERIYDGKFYYYLQDNSAKKTFLYYKDATSDVPVAVKDISAISGGANMTTIMTYKANEKYLYLTTYTYISSTIGINEIWRTDGTEAGTVKISTFTGATTNFFNIASLEYSVKSNVKAINSLNGDFIFSSSPTPNTRAIWITDGTPEGTTKLMENTVTNTATSAYAPIQKVGTRMLFSVYGANGWEIWSTDGTVSNTNFFSPLFATVGLLNGNFYYYSTIDGVSNTITYTTDGLSVESRPLSIPMTGIDGYINDNKELYTGTALGTVLYHTTDFSDMKKIADLPQTNTYFLAASDAGLLFAKLLDPFKSDEYTIYVGGRNSGINIINSGNILKAIGDAFAFKNTFYVNTVLKTDTQNYGRELWRMDNVHNEILKDIYPGSLVYSGINFPYASDPKGFFSQNGEMYFLATQSNGQKLFKFNPDFTFNNSSQDNNWNTKTNWIAGATPMLTDDAKVPSTQNILINGIAYASDLEVASPLDLTNGSLNVAGTLNINSKITLNNSNLTLKGDFSEIIGGNDTNYIITNGNSTANVENLNSSRGTVKIPVGSTTNYNPITLENTGISDSFSVKFSDGIANTSNGAVNGTWDISEGTAGGSNVNVGFEWNQTQENSTFARNSAKVGHFKNGAWVEENTGELLGMDPYLLSATGITTFSPFGILNFGTLNNADFTLNKASIYPNPFSDVLNILVTEDSVIQIFDASGKVINTQLLQKGTNTLQKLSFNKGIYMYEIKSQDGGTTSSGKVIKI